ncbi:family S53 protease [Mycena maculata]|uniref:tripeptidyl-peptidase II n=1 Tax=Mycena maculata TaxID=230809 RepID=A0AAD7IJB9_9AGAR|nr:family S53 protease [Mycena maculata]
MRLISLIPLAALLSVINGNPISRRAMVVLESVPAVPSGFTHAGTVSPSQEITLRIALVQTDIAGLQEKTYAVSDPANALYGQHLTPEEVAEYVKPTAETLSAVSEWLSENGITAKSVSPAGDLLQFSIPVSKAEALLATTFSSFTHVASGTTSIRTLSYSIPAVLKGHIQFVHPTIAFVPPPVGKPGVTAINHKREPRKVSRSSLTADAIPNSCASIVEPACLQDMYGFPTARANNSASNTLGVAGYIDQFANSEDLSLFLSNLRTNLVGSTFTLLTLDGGENVQVLSEAGDEADLDIEYTVGMAAGVPVTFISVGENFQDDVDGFIDIVNTILEEPAATRPTVLTTSYGFNEEDLPISLAVAMCDAYMQLGAVGISVIFASGDGGVGGVQPTTCTSFVPSAPGVCPFITSVGGSTGLPPQVAASLSGGGFSNYFPTPAFQAGDVATYIASIGDEYSGLYNVTGRGIPDVAAQAENVEIAWMGEFWLVGGTSCASPIFASMIALVNDRLIATGKPVLGYLNPFLYSPAGRAAFTDITSGTNPGCNTNGFSASVGWDPVTGLGTPNFDLLLAAVGL